MAGKMNVADLRKSYEKAELSEQESPSDPMLLFEKWLHEAIQAEIPEPNAMTLATVGKDGAPAARFLQTLRTGIENPAAWLLNQQPAAISQP